VLSAVSWPGRSAIMPVVFFLQLIDRSRICFFDCRYALLIGRPPFETQSLKETYKLIAQSRYPEPSSVSFHAKSLITSCLKVDPRVSQNSDFGNAGIKEQRSGTPGLEASVA